MLGQTFTNARYDSCTSLSRVRETTYVNSEMIARWLYFANSQSIFKRHYDSNYELLPKIFWCCSYFQCGSSATRIRIATAFCSVNLLNLQSSNWSCVFSEAKNQLLLDGWCRSCWYSRVRSSRCIIILVFVILVFGILICFFFGLVPGQS